MSDDLIIIVLTFNSASVIERTVAAAARVRPTIVCIDSGSTDDTVAILHRLGCQVLSRPFKNYADQRNWAIQTIGGRYAWQLHLDADEILDTQAIAAIRSAVADPGGHSGYLLKRRTYFLGRALRHPGTGIWHLRLFKSGSCEDRLYDQHFLCDGIIGRLDGWIHDMNVGTLTEWITRHNRWSDLEAQELKRPRVASSSALRPQLLGDPRQRRRSYKGWYYRAPLILRPWLYFLFRYFVLLGFLDGRAGFLYAFFQALWFRMLVDAKLSEPAAPIGSIETPRMLNEARNAANRR